MTLVDKISKKMRGPIIAGALLAPTVSVAQDTGNTAVTNIPTYDACFEAYLGNVLFGGVEGATTSDCIVYGSQMKKDFCEEKLKHVTAEVGFQMRDSARKSVLDDHPACATYLPTDAEIIEAACETHYDQFEQGDSVAGLLESMSLFTDCNDYTQTRTAERCEDQLAANYRRTDLEAAVRELSPGCEPFVQEAIEGYKAQEAAKLQSTVAGCIAQYEAKVEETGAAPNTIITTMLPRECKHYQAEIVSAAAREQFAPSEEGLMSASDLLDEAVQAMYENDLALREEVSEALSSNPEPFGESALDTLPEAGGSVWDGVVDDQQEYGFNEIDVGEFYLGDEESVAPQPTSRTQAVARVREVQRAQAADSLDAVVAQPAEPLVGTSDLEIGQDVYDVSVDYDPFSGETVQELNRRQLTIKEACDDVYLSLHLSTSDDKFEEMKLKAGPRSLVCQAWWYDASANIAYVDPLPESLIIEPGERAGRTERKCEKQGNFFADRGFGIQTINELISPVCKDMDLRIDAYDESLLDLTDPTLAQGQIDIGYDGTGSTEFDTLRVVADSLERAGEQFSPIRDSEIPDEWIPLALGRLPSLDLDLLGYRGFLEIDASREVEMPQILAHGPMMGLELYTPFGKKGFVLTDVEQLSFTWRDHQDNMDERSSYELDVDGAILAGSDTEEGRFAGGIMATTRQSWKFTGEDMVTANSYSLGPAARFAFDVSKKEVLDVFAGYALNPDRFGFDFTEIGMGHLRLDAELTTRRVEGADLSLGIRYDNVDKMVELGLSTAQVNLGVEELRIGPRIDAHIGENGRIGITMDTAFTRSHQEGYNGKNDWTMTPLELRLDVGWEWERFGEKRREKRIRNSRDDQPIEFDLDELAPFQGPEFGEDPSDVQE